MHRFSLKIFYVLVSIAVLVAVPLTLDAAEYRDDVAKVIFDNGAVLLSKYLPDSSIVNIQIRVLSGLSNEGKYAGSGISHFLEHVLFKGAGSMNSLEIRKAIKLMGGVSNASTGLDSAEYQITVMNKDFEKAFDLLTDIVMDPVFTEEDFATERDVILNEIRYRNDDPTNRRLKKLFAKAYSNNVYAEPIIGVEDRFLKLTSEDLKIYHAQAYAPDRVVIGVTGGISFDEALKTVEPKISKYTAKSDWDPVVAVEPIQTAPKKAIFSEEVAVGYLALGFHSTDIYSQDLYAGDVLSIIFGEGNSSRLYRELVKQKELLYSVSSFNFTPRYPGLFIVTAIGSPENLDQADKEIFNSIKRLEENGVAPEELAKAKNLVISDFLHSHEQVSNLNSIITTSEVFLKDPDFIRKYVENVNTITEEDIIVFCKKYLTEANSTVVELVPDFFAKEMGLEDAAVAESSPVSAEKVTTVAASSDRVLSDAIQPSGVLKKYETEQSEAKEEQYVILKNGLRVIIKEKGDLPIVSATLAVGGGLRGETAVNNGISNLAVNLALKGTESRTEKEIIPEIENRGGTIFPFSGMNSMGINFDILSKDLDFALQLLSEVVSEAVFPAEEIRKEKSKVIAAIEEEDKSLFEAGMNSLRKTLYGKHPYSLRVLGEVDSVYGISREMLQVYYKERFAPGEAVLTVVGGVDAGKTLSLVKKYFGEWEGQGRSLPKNTVTEINKVEEKNNYIKKEQALVLYGFYGADIHSEMKYPLYVVSSILSGSDGLLFDVLREEHGLAYVAGALSSPELDKGYFAIYAATIEDGISTVRESIEDSVSKMTAGEFSEEELIASKNRIMTQQAFALQSNVSMSLTMCVNELFGEGYDEYKSYDLKINKVSHTDVSRTAKNVLNLGNCGIEIIHPSDK